MQSIADSLKTKRFKKAALENFNNIPLRLIVRKTRFYIDNEYFKNGYARIFPNSFLAVYGVLAMHANHRNQTCFPSLQTICWESGVKNRNTVSKALKMFERFGFIAIVHSKGKYPNVYGLLSPQCWKSAEEIKKVFEAKTISKNNHQQYQTKPINSNPIDTRNHISESYK